MIWEVVCVCVTCIACWAMWLRDSHEARLEATEAAQLRAEMKTLCESVDTCLDKADKLGAEVGTQVQKLIEHENKIMRLQYVAQPMRQG